MSIHELDVVQAADVVVTMGCGDACPIDPGERHLDWVVGDPAGQDLAVVRTIRDAIARRVTTLLEEVAPTATRGANAATAPTDPGDHRG